MFWFGPAAPKVLVLGTDSKTFSRPGVHCHQASLFDCMICGSYWQAAERVSGAGEAPRRGPSKTQQSLQLQCGGRVPPSQRASPCDRRDLPSLCDVSTYSSGMVPDVHTLAQVLFRLQTLLSASATCARHQYGEYHCVTANITANPNCTRLAWLHSYRTLHAISRIWICWCAAKPVHVLCAMRE